MNRLPFEKQVAVVSALTEGCSIRSTERLVGCHRDTVMRLGLRIGEACERFHDETVKDLRSSLIECDEAWDFVRCKQRNAPEDDPEAGDQYLFLAMDSIAKGIISYRVGRRTLATAEEFAKDLRARVLGRPQITTDAFPGYYQALQRAFRWDLDYAQVRKIYQGETGPQAQHRYSPGRIRAIRKENMVGQPDSRFVSTSHCERLNLSLRTSSRRFARLSLAYSKKLRNHCAAVSLFVNHYNWCRIHETVRTTPAHAMGLADRPWSVAELMEAATSAGSDPSPRRPQGPKGGLRLIRGGLS